MRVVFKLLICAKRFCFFEQEKSIFSWNFFMLFTSEIISL